jgi:predicted nucleotidyltransferase
MKLKNLSSFLVKKLGARTAILFGSMARKDSNASSDIDLLLVTCLAFKPREVKKLIPKSLLPKSKHLSLSIYPTRQFATAYEEGALFLVHLTKEGRVLYDDGFYKELTRKPFVLSNHKIKMSIRILKQRLAMADDLRKFNNLFIGVLGDFFSISKNLTYILLAIDGLFIFDKKKAFAKLAEKYPEYKKEIQELQDLEPFFLRNVKGISRPLPFSSSCEEKVVEMRNYIRELLILGEEKIECKH